MTWRGTVFTQVDPAHDNGAVHAHLEYPVVSLWDEQRCDDLWHESQHRAGLIP